MVLKAKDLFILSSWAPSSPQGGMGRQPVSPHPSCGVKLLLAPLGTIAQYSSGLLSPSSPPA